METEKNGFIPVLLETDGGLCPLKRPAFHATHFYDSGL